MSEKIFDLIIIGGGPGGYVCAIKAAQLGFKVACIEMRKQLGGTCLNEGCIPSKNLLNSTHHYYYAKKNFKNIGIDCSNLEIDLTQMMKNKDQVISDLGKGIDFLFKKNKVEKFTGIGKIIKAEGEIKQVTVTPEEEPSSTLSSKYIVIATGSTVNELNFKIDEKKILSSKGALCLTKIPESMLVIGGGVIGVELASVWSRLGAKVTVIEYSDKITPSMDSEISHTLQKTLEKQGVKFQLSCKLEALEIKDEKVVATTKNSTFEAELALIAAGRKPYLGDIGVKLETDAKGHLVVNKKFETNIKGVFAIGDIIKGPMLAHKAEEEGAAVAELLHGRSTHHGFIPSVIYTSPEVASVGQTEEELNKLNISYKVSKFPFAANSRAKATGETEGFIKIIVDQNDTIIGIHIIGPQAGTLIAIAVVAMEYTASAEDIASICFSHPDFTEVFKEAALGAFFKPIHN